MQQSIQRRERALLETKSKVTHPVYSLYFPEEKQEWWWLYIADRRDQTLVSMPYHVCTLKDTEEVSYGQTGKYTYMCSNHTHRRLVTTCNLESQRRRSKTKEVVSSY